MKLSEKLRQRRHDDITMLHHSNIGMELIRDAEQLEEENEQLRALFRPGDADTLLAQEPE